MWIQYLLEMENRNKALFFFHTWARLLVEAGSSYQQTLGHLISVAEVLSNGFRFKAHWQQLIAQTHRKPERF